jgi:hypothetical protein
MSVLLTKADFEVSTVGLTIGYIATDFRLEASFVGKKENQLFYLETATKLPYQRETTKETGTRSVSKRS